LKTVARGHFKILDDSQDDVFQFDLPQSAELLHTPVDIPAASQSPLPTGPSLQDDDSFPLAYGASVPAAQDLSASKPLVTVPQLADYLINGFWQYNYTIAHHWASNTITYNINGLNAAEQFLAQSALNAWHEVANVTFVQTSGTANITFNHNGSMTAFETDSYSGSGVMSSATVDISADWITNDGGAYDGKTGIDSYGYQTYIHEIGHALGLGHQGPYNGSASYSSNAIFADDTWQYSVMSYFAQSSYGGSYRYVVTPQMADIYAVDAIYGESASTRTGDTTYGFHNTAGSIYNFSNYAQAPALTIYDSAGVDTLDCSGYSFAQAIDLRSGNFSSIGGLINNIGIALNCVIENAVGGSGNDIIDGNSANNVLSGGSGLDTYTFSASSWGSDRIIDVDSSGQILFTGVASLAILTHQFVGTISGGNFVLTDQLNGSQITLQGVTSPSGWTFGYTSGDFSGSGSPWTSIAWQNLRMVDNHAPVVTVTGSTTVQPFGHGAPSWVSGDHLPFIVSDADGDAIVSYRFTDVDASSTSAVLWYGGSFLAQGATVEFAASNLPNFWLEGGTVNGTNALQVQVFDGLAWSAVQSIAVTTYLPASHAPVVSVSGSTTLQTLGHGAPSWVSGDHLPFTVSDADGDAILSYRFTDVDASSASAVLWYAGSFLTQGATVEVTASNLSNFWLEGGTSAGIDTLRVQAFDGVAWSVAQDITVTSAAPANHAPVVSVTGSSSVETFGHGAPAWLSGDHLPFTVSDVDGDAIVSYRFTDVGSGSTSAVLWYDGSFLAQGATVDVAAGNLANFWLEGGTVAGTDAIRVQAFDGVSWSAAQDITITTSAPVSHAPVVSVTGSTAVQTFGHGTPSWLSGDHLPFTASSLDTSGIVTYRFTDVGTSSTSVVLWYGGSFLAQGATVDVAANNLSNFWLEGGTIAGTDTLRVQAFDGVSWSAPQDIAITTTNSNINLAAGVHDAFVFKDAVANRDAGVPPPHQDQHSVDHDSFAGRIDHFAFAANDEHANAPVATDHDSIASLEHAHRMMLGHHGSDFQLT
jgi:hypothetical protein